MNSIALVSPHQATTIVTDVDQLVLRKFSIATLRRDDRIRYVATLTPNQSHDCDVSVGIDFVIMNREPQVKGVSVHDSINRDSVGFISLYATRSYVRDIGTELVSNFDVILKEQFCGSLPLKVENE